MSPLSEQGDWRRHYEALWDDANEVYSTAFVLIQAGDLDGALNELQEASKRLDARKLFDASGLGGSSA